MTDGTLYEVFVNVGLVDDPTKGDQLEAFRASSVSEAAIQAFGRNKQNVPNNLFSVVVEDVRAGEEVAYEMSVADMNRVREIALKNGAGRYVVFALDAADPTPVGPYVAYEKHGTAIAYWESEGVSHDVVVAPIGADRESPSAETFRLQDFETDGWDNLVYSPEANA